MTTTPLTHTHIYTRFFLKKNADKNGATLKNLDVYLCCVSFAKAQEAPHGADAEDCPGDTQREGAGETGKCLSHLGFEILPEPR